MKETEKDTLNTPESDGRRRFIKRTAKTLVYATPVIMSMNIADHAHAQLTKVAMKK